MPSDDLPVLPFESRAAWEAWLTDQHATADGVWMKVARKGSGNPSISYDEAVEVALCFGWIDGQVRRLDDEHWVQRYTPRRRRSRWSRINRDRATALIEAGAMRPAGLREVEAAKADGRWEAAYEPPSTAAVPDDLQRELELNDRARKFFETLDPQNRYAILYRIQDAKKPETRARRVAKFVAMLAEGQKLYP